MALNRGRFNKMRKFFLLYIFLLNKMAKYGKIFFFICQVLLAHFKTSNLKHRFDSFFAENNREFPKDSELL